jgi:hypothetical protein
MPPPEAKLVCGCAPNRPVRHVAEGLSRLMKRSGFINDETLKMPQSHAWEWRFNATSEF